MSIQRTLLPLAYFPLTIVDYCRQIFGLESKRGRLRALLFHDVAPDQYSVFRKKIEWLAKRWNIVSAEQFVDMLVLNEPVIGNNLLLTFDDGFSSDRIIAEDVLNPMGISALFFVISGFVSLESRAEQISFITNNLYPPSSGEKVPEHIASLKNMTLQDLKYLVKTGHTIGAHTATHARLSSLSEEKDLINEIALSADWLQDQLGIKIKHFAYSFGNLESFSREALQIARKRFPYIYTGMRGNNAQPVQPWAIRRDMIAITDPLSLVGAFVAGAADFHYKKKLRIYESWGEVEF